MSKKPAKKRSSPSRSPVNKAEVARTGRIRDQMRCDFAHKLIQRAARVGYLDIESLIRKRQEEISLPNEEWITRIAERLIRKIAVQKREPSDFESIVDRVLLSITPLEGPRFLAELGRQWRQSNDKQENGRILAEEGRAARKPRTDWRADRICKLYRRIRPTSRTNGAALEAVSRQFGPLPGKEKPITVQAIRKILKRCGVSCR